MTRSVFPVLAIVAALSAALPAQATVRSFTFTATVNPSSQGADLSGANSAVTGSFSYDDAALVSQGPYVPPGSVWFAALQSFSFTMGSLSGTANVVPTDSVLVRDNFVGVHDGFFIQPQTMVGPARLGQPLLTADLSLIDSSQSVYSALVLPSSLNLGSFDSAMLHVAYQNSDVYATIDSLTAAPVPEPATWALMGAGLLLVARSSRRVRK